MLKVIQTFVGHGYNMPAVGSLIDPPEALAAHLVKIGVAVPVELAQPKPVPAKPVAATVQPKPENKASPKSSGSSQPAPVSTRKTAKRSKKTAKK